MHYKKADRKVLKGLFLIVMAVLLLPLVSSCGKNAAVAPASSTTKLLIVDASVDLLPMQVYIGNLQLGTKYFNYPTVTNYYSVFSGTQTFQVRNHYGAAVFFHTDTLRDNRNYSLFVVGLATATTHADTLSYIFTTDYSTLSTPGYGKIRFVNASPRTTGLDVYANGTQAFSNITYKSVSSYIQVPAGIYSFKVTPNNTPASVLTTLPNVTVQDGRLYTLYTRGLIGRTATDTAAFTAAVITNQ
jgi:hypothetical protein